MNEMNSAYQVLGLLFLLPALGFSITLIISGVLEAVDGPAPYIDKVANRSVVGITVCMLAWWYVATV